MCFDDCKQQLCFECVGLKGAVHFVSGINQVYLLTNNGLLYITFL